MTFYMLLFLGLTNAIYFYHLKTNSFLGIKKDKGFTGFEYIGPVGSISNAIDFHILQHEKELNETIRISLSEKDDRVLDAESGQITTNLPIIVFPKNNGNAQKFTLKLLADNSFIIGYHNLCLTYDENHGGFRTDSCNSKKLMNSKIDLYFEREEPVSYKFQEKHNFYPKDKIDWMNPFKNSLVLGSKNDHSDSINHTINSFKADNKGKKLMIIADLSGNQAIFSSINGGDFEEAGVRLGHSVISQKSWAKGQNSGLFKHNYLDKRGHIVMEEASDHKIINKSQLTQKELDKGMHRLKQSLSSESTTHDHHNDSSEFENSTQHGRSRGHNVRRAQHGRRRVHNYQHSTDEHSDDVHSTQNSHNPHANKDHHDESYSNDSSYTTHNNESVVHVKPQRTFRTFSKRSWMVNV